MRLYHNILPMMLIFIASSCQQKIDLASVASFQVATDSASYNVGSKTIFNFSGNPYTITFYSGEIGHRYAYRNRTSTAGTPLLNFTSALNSGVQLNSLQVVVSSDFKGIVAGDSATTISNLGSATWTDITSRANLATNSTATASAINLLDIASAGKPVYIAFKYTAQSGSVQNKWTITGLTLTNQLSDGSIYTIANLVANTTPITSNYAGVNTFSPGWVPYNVKNTYNWVVTAGTSLVITGATTAATATSNAEAWVIMGSIDLTKVTQDVGVAIKNIAAQLPSYPYPYGAAGIYTATFVASSVNVNAMDSISRTIPVQVH